LWTTKWAKAEKTKVRPIFQLTNNAAGRRPHKSITPDGSIG